MGINLANYSYLHASGDGGPRRTTQVIVIHATDNTATAADEASYATHRPDQTSAHFYVDAVKPYRGLPLDNIAYGCLWHGNQISIQLELCGRSNQLSDATLRQAAPIVAALCAQYGIPVRKASAAQVAAGVKGICGHADITEAFPQDGGDHTDPGASFPWERFISYVSGGAGSGEDDDMTPEQDAMLREVQAVLRMHHWTWAPTEADYVRAGGSADVYKAVGAGSLVPALATLRAGGDTAAKDLIALKLSLGAAMSAIDSLAKAIAAGGGNVDVAAIKAEILDAENRVKADVDAHFQRIADAQQAATNTLNAP